MSNFFEQELRKLFEDGKVIQDPVFVGRACLGGLDAGRQVRAEFVTMAMRITMRPSASPCWTMTWGWWIN